MKRIERAAVITQTLTENPNKDYSLGYFAELFDCAKSSISEDIKTIKEAMEEAKLGYLETTSGAKGGVRYVPYVDGEEAVKLLSPLRDLYMEDDRVLGSGFLYTSDIMFSPVHAKAAARVFAKRFAATDADIIVTVETKGIGVALFTAELLNLPLAVLRRENRVSEGSTVSINYFSGSADRVQQMSLSKRALKEGSRAIIIDDFMRGGGSIKGIEDMLSEFGAKCVGIGVVVVAGGKENKKIGDYFPLLILDDRNGKIEVTINEDI